METVILPLNYTPMGCSAFFNTLFHFSNPPNRNFDSKYGNPEMLASCYDIEIRTLNPFTHLRELSDRRQPQHWECATITPYRNFGWLVRLELTLPVPQTDVLTINTITTIFFVATVGLEPTTTCISDRYSILLSYVTDDNWPNCHQCIKLSSNQPSRVLVFQK